MATHIQDNTAAPVANQVGRLKLEPSDILTTPHQCLQLAKATELLFHDIPDDLLKQCIPKEVRWQRLRHYLLREQFEKSCCKHQAKDPEERLRSDKDARV